MSAESPNGTQAELEPDRAPWRRRKDQRRPEILDAARAVLEEFGSERASLGEIARRASVSEATVYKYFENKQDLVRQVIEAWMEPNLVRLERELPALETARARLQLLTVRHLHEMQSVPGLHRLVYTQVRWGEYRGSLQLLNQRYSRIVVSIIADGIDRGEIRADVDTRLARDMLFGSLEHLGWRVVYGGQPIAVEAASRHLVDQFLAGVAPPAAVGADEDAQRLAMRLDRAIAALETLHPPAAE